MSSSSLPPFLYVDLASIGSCLLAPFLLFNLQHSSVLKKVDKNNTSNLKSKSSSGGAVKKRKRRSIAGLAKVC